MYQALYRKYRPTVFEDVVGQAHITKTLKNELKLGRIHHAYLFTGSRGCGKTTCAKILSKAVNCLDLQDYDPCGVCENCVGIDSGDILDVVEMDAASNRGIDDVRAIIEEVNFAPAKAKYRVYIIDEAHMITTDAWNALLKTLEEPPAHVIFIFATTDVGKIPATILSRCQRFDFKRITPEDIAARVKLICEKENIAISDEAALLISVIADGALRDALSVLDRCIGLSYDVTADVVRRAAGLASKVHLFELCDCIVNKNVSKALERVAALYHDSKNMMSLCDELIAHLRALMLIKSVKNPREMLVMSDREFSAAVAQADYLSLADVVYYMDVLSRAYARMSKSLNPRYELEMAVVKLCAPELDSTDEALTARVAALEKAVKALKNAPPAAPVVSKPSEPLVPFESDLSSSEDSASDEDFSDSSEPAATVTPSVFAEFESTAEPEELAAPEEFADSEEPAVPETPSQPMSETPPAPDESDAPPKPSSASASAVPAALAEETPRELPAETSPESDDSLAEDAAPAADVPPVEKPAEPAQPSVKKKRQVDMKALYENAVPFPQWRDIVNSIKSYSVAIYSAFMDSNAYVSGDYLLIETDNEIAFKLMRESSQRQNIRNAVMENTGRMYNLGPYKKPEEEGKKDDVLDNFIEKLKSSGIAVNEE